MIITKEWVDIVCPRHSRKSCNDDNLINYFGGWNKKYNPDTGDKVIKYPGCNRCYLLDNIGMDTADLEFTIRIEVILDWNRGDI